MKHLLNDLSEEEKNKIREQHTGGKKIMIENFNQLLNKKLGEVKPLINEQAGTPNPIEKCLKDKKITTVLPKECIDTINEILSGKGGAPTPADEKSKFEACAAKLGPIQAISVIPAILSCVSSAQGDDSPVAY
jgi:hypothetical protein